MAKEISMNGRKKIGSIRKEFTEKFNFLTLIFLDNEMNPVEDSRSIADIRTIKGTDLSIVASLKVNTLEKRFQENFGIKVEIAYSSGGTLHRADENETRSLNELNQWCQENGCDQIDTAKSAGGKKKQPRQKSDDPATETSAPKNLQSGVGDDFLFEDPIPLITLIQSIRNYFIGLDRSPEFREFYEEQLRALVSQVIIPRVSNDIVRTIHEAGMPVDALCLNAMFKAEESYDQDFETHQDYITALDQYIHAMMPLTDKPLRLALLKLFFNLGQQLNDENSPSGSLKLQDRFFVAFLAIRIWPEMDAKGIDTNYFKAAGLTQYLTREEKFALVLYDFILVSANNELEIKQMDIGNAKALIADMTGNSSSENLVGGFEDNWAFEMFQFYNVWLRHDLFHDMCVGIWHGLCMETSPETRKKFTSALTREFMADHIRDKPYLKDYDQPEETSKIHLGERLWMTENLNVNTFRNGDTIPEARTNAEWFQAGENRTPAWCYYTNDPNNGSTYGKLYNWYAVADLRGLAPEGWRIPEQEDFESLLQALGSDAKQKLLKGADTGGFSGLMAGIRLSNGDFVELGTEGSWWSATNMNDEEAWSVSVVYEEFNNPKGAGLSVRCVWEE